MILSEGERNIVSGKLEIKRPNLFQVAIHFHPDHPWGKTLLFSRVNKTGVRF